MLSKEERKQLLKIYTNKMRVYNTIDESIDSTLEEFLTPINVTRLLNEEEMIPEEYITKLLNNVEGLLHDVNEEKLKNRFNDRNYIEKRFAEVASKLRRIPTIEDMEGISVTRARIRTTHGNITSLAQFSQVKFPHYFEYAHEFKELINDENKKWIAKTIAENDIFSVFGITAAPVVEENLASIMNFHVIEGGMPIFIPMCKRIEDIDQTIIDMFLKRKCILLLEDLDINENVKVKYVNQNEKSADATRGFRKESPGKSVIFAGISQTVKVLPTKKGGHPRIHFSTGTISANHHRASINHNKNPHAPRNLAAETIHFMSGWLIEKISDKLFIPTQIMFDQNHEFTVYGRKYTKNSLILNSPLVHVYGDIHEKEHSKQIMSNSLKIGKSMGIPEAVYHDLYDCTSGSNWNEGRLMYKAYSYLKGESSWAHEVKGTASFLNISTQVYKKSYIVDSNHDDMLLRAMDRGNVFKDPENAFFAFLLGPSAIISFFEKEAIEENPMEFICDRLGINMKALMNKFGFLKDKTSLLEHAVSLFGIDNPEKIEWLDLDSRLNIGGYDLADHGHKASNGSKGSMAGFVGNFIKMVFGHLHQPSQENHILGLGHNIDMSPAKKPKYAKGGTSGWMYADVFIYNTGTSHHVFTINGFRSRFLGDEALGHFSKNKSTGLRNKVHVNLFDEYTSVAVGNPAPNRSEERAALASELENKKNKAQLPK
jgi:hypothetical protein